MLQMRIKLIDSPTWLELAVCYETEFVNECQRKNKVSSTGTN
jgi:hypothetical protein